MDKIFNLTQHIATPDQITAGVVEPKTDIKERVQNLLTFNCLPAQYVLKDHAITLAAIARNSGCTKAMIGGAPWFMTYLEEALRCYHITPVYAFSVRQSVEEIVDDKLSNLSRVPGRQSVEEIVDDKVVKKAVSFVHARFITGTVKTLRLNCWHNGGSKCQYWSEGDCLASLSEMDDDGQCTIDDDARFE